MANVSFGSNSDRIPMPWRAQEEGTIRAVISELRPADETWHVVDREPADKLSWEIDFTCGAQTHGLKLEPPHSDASTSDFSKRIRYFIKNWPIGHAGSGIK